MGTNSISFSQFTLCLGEIKKASKGGKSSMVVFRECIARKEENQFIKISYHQTNGSLEALLDSLAQSIRDHLNLYMFAFVRQHSGGKVKARHCGAIRAWLILFSDTHRLILYIYPMMISLLNILDSVFATHRFNLCSSFHVVS